MKVWKSDFYTIIQALHNIAEDEYFFSITSIYVEHNVSSIVPEGAQIYCKENSNGLETL